MSVEINNMLFYVCHYSLIAMTVTRVDNWALLVLMEAKIKPPSLSILQNNISRRRPKVRRNFSWRILDVGIFVNLYYSSFRVDEKYNLMPVSRGLQTEDRHTSC